MYFINRQSSCRYTSSKPKTKKWFSQTYVPRFNWVKEKAAPRDRTTDLTRSNELVLERQRLAAVNQPISPLLSSQQYPRNEWNELTKTYVQAYVMLIPSDQKVFLISRLQRIVYS